MKDFGKAGDPLGARLALLPIVFSLPHRIFSINRQHGFVILQLEKGKTIYSCLRSLPCHRVLPLFLCFLYHAS